MRQTCEYFSGFPVSPIRAESKALLRFARNHNEISYLTGIPSSLRTLLIASNRLTSLTSFHHLYNLERLDISNNQLDSVEHLSALRHLRDLKADGNQISSIAGLDGLDGLVRLSLKGNQLCDEIDFTGTKW